MIPGFDVLQQLTHLAPRIKPAGFLWVGRYLKNLLLAEVQALDTAGVSIVSIWEKRGDRASMTRDNGLSDGAEALRLARSLGQPPGSAIYAAIDYPADRADMPAIILYFGGFGSVLGANYRLGAYGPGGALDFLHGAGVTTYSYLAGAMGWWGSREFKAAGKGHIYQHPTIANYALGIEIDPCEAVDGDFGQWQLPPPVPRTQPTLIPPARDLQTALNGAGAELRVDGIWGPASARALATYYLKQS